MRMVVFYKQKNQIEHTKKNTIQNTLDKHKDIWKQKNNHLNFTLSDVGKLNPSVVNGE